MAVRDLRQSLAKYQTVFLDTMVFVYVLEQHPIFAELAETVLEAVEAGELVAATSSLTLAEVLTGPANARNLRVLNDYELYIRNFPNLAICDLEARHARSVAEVCAATRLRTPDAVQIALARAVGADAIIGNDKAWTGKTTPLDLLLLLDFVGS